MSDSAHFLEELRSLRGAHVDLMAKMSEVCGEIRELTIELRHTQKNYDTLNERMLKNEADIREIQLENAVNRPLMDVAKRMYWSQWGTIIAAATGTVGMNWTKLFGGG